MTTKLEQGLGVAADMRMQIARGAEGDYRQSRSTLDTLVGYFVRTSANDKLIMRWPAEICAKAGLNASHQRYPQSTDLKA